MPSISGLRANPSRVQVVLGDTQSWMSPGTSKIRCAGWVSSGTSKIECPRVRGSLMDGSKNLTVARGEKSVWDKPSLSTSLASYDQERWIMAAWGSGLVMVGARRGGFGGGLLAM